MLTWPAWLALCVMAMPWHAEAQDKLRSEDSADRADRSEDDDKLKISSIKPLELEPGAAIVVHVDALETTDMPNVEIAKLDAEVLHRDGARLIVRVPHAAPIGPAKVRVTAGDRRSKPWVITLRELPRNDMLRGVLGGLALLLLGLRAVGQALRAYAGSRVRAVLAQLTHGRVRPAALGTLVGFLLQTTTSVAGLLAGLSAARMIKQRAAVTLLMGAQFGAATAAVVLPLLATREALWIVAAGAAWTLVSKSRTSRALGMVVVGAGVMLHGLSLLQTGLSPLMSDPQLMPHLRYFDSTDALGMLRCVGAGALLTALLQGPSPVFALVLSLVHSSGTLTVRDGLAVLAGVSLGSVVGTALATLSFGSAARRMATSHVLLGVVGTCLSLAALPLWAAIAQSLSDLGPQPGVGIASVHPASALGLGGGFLACMLTCTTASIGLAQWSTRIAERLRLHLARASVSPPRAQDEHSKELAASLAHFRRALTAARDVTRSADRSAAETAVHALNDGRASLLQLLSEGTSPPAMLRTAALAGMQLASAVEAALRVAEKAPEHGFTLASEQLASEERMFSLAQDALNALIEHLSRRAALTLLHAQTREIEINALDADVRRKLLEGASDHADKLPKLLWASELFAAYEGIGNQLYRIAGALLADELD